MDRKIVVLVVILLIALPSLLRAKNNEVVVCSWGGETEQAQKIAYFDPFEKATGIKVIVTASPKASRIKAMVDSKNVEWDIVVAAGGIYGTCERLGLLDKIDYKYFDKETLDNLYPEAKLPYAVGNYYFSFVLSYSTRRFPKGDFPKNWAEFWDIKKYPDPRSFGDLSTGGKCWEFALLADGFPKNQLYKNPDLNRAFRKLTEIKPYVTKWWTQGAEPGQLLMDGEVVMVNGYSMRMQQLHEQGAPVNYHFNEGLLDLEYLFIPKGSPNYENAVKLIAFMSKADTQAHYSKIYAAGPSNKKAFASLSPEICRKMPSYPENKDKQIFADLGWYRDNMEKVNQMWDSWILKK